MFLYLEEYLVLLEKIWEFTLCERFEIYIRRLLLSHLDTGIIWSDFQQTNLKIFATKVPPCLRRWVVMLRAASNSWACMYSSISCRPVTSGAPSHTTRSAFSPANSDTILLAVASLVMSPWSWVTPGRGAIACRSTATILTSWRSASGLWNYKRDLISNFSWTFLRNQNFLELKWLSFVEISR